MKSQLILILGLILAGCGPSTYHASGEGRGRILGAIDGGVIPLAQTLPPGSTRSGILGAASEVKIGVEQDRVADEANARAAASEHDERVKLLASPSYRIGHFIVVVLLTLAGLIAAAAACIGLCLGSGALSALWPGKVATALAAITGILPWDHQLKAVGTKLAGGAA